MGVTYIGSGITARLNETVDHTVRIDKTGVASATLSYYCEWSVAARLVAALRYHPDFPWLKKEDAEIHRTEGYIAEVTVNYKGVDPDSDSGGGGQNGEVVTYSLEESTDAEPIETHKDFTTLAGVWSDPGTWEDCTFNPATGEFLGFTNSSQHSGVRSYLAPSTIYSRTRTLSSLLLGALGVTTKDDGKIDNPPPSRLLPSAPGRTWLKLGTSAEDVGDGVRIVERWKLSSRVPWNTSIYETAGDA